MTNNSQVWESQPSWIRQEGSWNISEGQLKTNQWWNQGNDALVCTLTVVSFALCFISDVSPHGCCEFHNAQTWLICLAPTTEGGRRRTNKKSWNSWCTRPAGLVVLFHTLKEVWRFASSNFCEIAHYSHPLICSLERFKWEGVTKEQGNRQSIKTKHSTAKGRGKNGKLPAEECKCSSSLVPRIYEAWSCACCLLLPRPVPRPHTQHMKKHWAYLNHGSDWSGTERHALFREHLRTWGKEKYWSQSSSSSVWAFCTESHKTNIPWETCQQFIFIIQTLGMRKLGTVEL